MTSATLDHQTDRAAWQGSAQAQNGRAAATALRRDAAVTAAAVAPATGSPSGLPVLVSSMDDRLAAIQRHIDSSAAQNRILAAQLNDTATGYRSIQTTPTSRLRLTQTATATRLRAVVLDWHRKWGRRRDLPTQHRGRELRRRRRKLRLQEPTHRRGHRDIGARDRA